VYIIDTVMFLFVTNIVFFNSHFDSYMSDKQLYDNLGMLIG